MNTIPVWGLTAALLLATVDPLAQVAELPLAPYEEVPMWGPAVAGSLEWEPAGMEADSAGRVYLLRRSDPALLVIDPAGGLLKTFSSAMFVWAHGLHVDREGHIWATDCTIGTPSKDLQPKNPAALAAGRGHQVYKFGPDGALLLTLGTRGESGGGTSHFNCPADVVTAADGSIFVSDGHDGMPNVRVVKFTPGGTFVTAWGRPGAGPGEFAGPHALAFDSRGRLLVGDRGNKRIQVFDQEGTFLEQFTGWGGPAGIAITADDTMFVTDNARRIVTVGSARTGLATGVIPNVFAEPIAADNDGNLYVGEVHPHTIRKFRRRH